MSMEQVIQDKKLLPLRSIAKEGPYSLSYLSNLVQRKKLKAKKIGRNYFSSKQWFSEYLEKHGRVEMEEPVKNEETDKKLQPLRALAKEGPYSLSYLSNLVQRKKLKAKKIGRNYLSSKEWLNEYLEKHAQDRVLSTLAPKGRLAERSGAPRMAPPSAEAKIDVDDLSDKIATRIISAGMGERAARPVAFKKTRRGWRVLKKVLPKRLEYRLVLTAVSTIIFSLLLVKAAPTAADNLANIFNYAYLYPWFKITKIDETLIPEKEAAAILVDSLNDSGLSRVAGKKEYAKGSEPLEEMVMTAEERAKQDARQSINYFKDRYVRIAGFIINGGKKVYFGFLELINPVVLEDESFGVKKPEPEKKEEPGALVVPYKDKKQAETMQEQVDRMFSDEVTVAPDESGRSGIIKPVFGGEISSQKYLYMMVPVNEEEKD